MNWVICSAGEVSVGKKGPPISKDGRGAGDVSPPQNPRCSCRFCCCCCRSRSAILTYHHANGKRVHTYPTRHTTTTLHICANHVPRTPRHNNNKQQAYTLMSPPHATGSLRAPHASHTRLRSSSVPNRSTRIPAAAPGPLSHTRPHRLTPTVSSRVPVAAPGPQTHTLLHKG